MRRNVMSVLEHATKTIFTLLLILTSLAALPAWAADGTPTDWTSDFQLGVIGNTTDGTAFALNMGFDRFLTPNLSVGPLMQLATTPDLFQTALSGQVKLWLDLKKGTNPLRVALQGGLGFVHADHLLDDTSFLIPIGIEATLGLTSRLELASSFLLNFTDLDTGLGNTTNIMPSWTVGIRY
jgi:hypothetical protein